MRLATASTDTYMEIYPTCRLDFYHEDIRLTDGFLVASGLREDVVIGATTMQKWRIKPDFEHDTILVDPGVAKLNGKLLVMSCGL